MSVLGCFRLWRQGLATVLILFCYMQLGQERVWAQITVAVGVDGPGSHMNQGYVLPRPGALGGRTIDESFPVNPSLSVVLQYGFPNIIQPFFGIEAMLPRAQQDNAGNFFFVSPHLGMRAYLTKRRYQPFFSFRAGPTLFRGDSEYLAPEYEGTSYERVDRVRSVKVNGKYHIGGNVGIRTGHWFVQVGFSLYQGQRHFDDLGPLSATPLARPRLNTRYTRIKMAIGYML